MNSRAPWFSRALVGCGLLVACQALVVSLPSDATTETPCAALKRWAQPYEHARPTLEHFATFDRAHRLAIFNAVTPAVRATLMQDQLRRFSTSADLSASQRALITEAIPLTTPALYEHDAAATHAFDQFWARAESSFTSRADKRVWYDLGSAVSPSVFTARPGSTSYGSLCNCKKNTTNECSNCVGGSCTQWQGCGADGLQTCNGLCQ
jgi:hypothetical protein